VEEVEEVEEEVVEYSPDGAEDAVDVWVLLVLGSQHEHVLWCEKTTQYIVVLYANICVMEQHKYIE